MRTKLLVILLGLLGLFSAAIVFRVDQLLFADKLNVSEAQARAQVGAVSETITSDLKAASETMEMASPQILADKKDYPKGKPYSRFVMLATISKMASGEWNIDSKAFLENSPAKSWAANYATLALKGVKETKVPVGSMVVLSLLDPSRKVYFLIATHTATQWLAGLIGPEVFQGAMDRQKGLASTFFVVNSMGQTLGHTVPEYVGSLMSDDPIVADLVKNESGSGFGVFQSASGPVQGFYEQVPQSNVFVVVSTPMSEILAGRKDVRWQLVLMGLGFALVGTALVMSFIKEKQTVIQVPAPHVMPTVPAFVTSPMAESEKLQAYTHAASSLAHELRGPLLSLLGRTRLLRESVHDEKIEKDLLKIEEGAREAHGTLHKLLTFSGEKDEPMVPTSVGEVLTRTLRMMESKLQNAGIQVEPTLAETPLIQGQPSLLMKAFEQILDNSVEAMHRGHTKKIIIELRPQEGHAYLKIQDTGEGIAPDHLEKIFDPFFTTKASTHHSGLGLPLALGIIRACGGRINVKSTPGQGTELEMLFAPDATSVVVEAPKIEEEIRYQRRERPSPSEDSALLAASLETPAAPAPPMAPNAPTEGPPAEDAAASKAAESADAPVIGEAPAIPVSAAPPAPKSEVSVDADGILRSLPEETPVAPVQKSAPAAPKIEGPAAETAPAWSPTDIPQQAMPPAIEETSPQPVAASSEPGRDPSVPPPPPPFRPKHEPTGHEDLAQEVKELVAKVGPLPEMPSVLNDQLMEKALDMIDQLDDEPPAFKNPHLQVPSSEPPPFKRPTSSGPVELSMDELVSPPPANPATPPPVTATAPPPPGSDLAKFTAKIDKPSINLKKKESRLMDKATDVRRPGDRS